MVHNSTGGGQLFDNGDNENDFFQGQGPGGDLSNLMSGDFRPNGMTHNQYN